MKKTASLPAILLLATTALALPASGYAGQAPAGAPGAPAAVPFVRTITPVRGDLYKVQSGPGIGAVTVFLVTPEGIVLLDPLNNEFSGWLKAELATRFPGKPVKYVVQTHYHWDHARGGGVFADTAQFVGHASMPGKFTAKIRDARPPGDTNDVDGDDRLDKQEAQTGTRAQFDTMDANRDGFLTQAEMLADVRKPDITFTDRYTITLGGKRVELIHAGGRHTSDLVDVHFPAERVLFAQDYIWPRRLCCNFAFDRMPMSTWINSLRNLERLDFDTFVGSHWEGGSRADFVAVRQYFEDFESAVTAGIRAGQSLDDMKKSIRLDKYKDWVGYEQLPGFIESAYTSLVQYAAR
jgi:glyoxylase-like metal-dependent hydrolase (beta-lactamase superfamily II)